MKEDPLWFKNAVIYEVHVRSFCDSTADGIGDFRGLRSKLGYFQDLGITALWLLPFYPSPLRDDGYDISDYFSVNPTYGTLDDFQEFLSEAHGRGLRVITELVINHTSDKHPWFQRARYAPAGSQERDFYVWSETPRRYEEARIIFKDFESSNWAWDPVAHSYYWHRFYSHQPDLNFDSPQVRQSVFEILDFWLGMGVDGLRLDAVPYLFEREGTSCENLQETHEYLRMVRRHVDEKFPGRMLLAEANQWPEDAVAYFGKGDECHMEFHFPLMPRLFMALQMEDRFPLIDILEQTPEIPDTCQWAIFLRNHDELTLEMVTDEERDYMVRIYAEDVRARLNLGIRRRLAPLLGNSRHKIELINSLLLSLPGTPIIYYGDEIGMGDNFYLGDRNGVRTPMQWSADRNAGFSRANPQQLFLPVIIDPEFHYETINVDVQQKNLSSLFWWTRRILAVRQKHAAFSHGRIEFLSPENAKTIAYLRRYEGQTLLIVANLSRFSQGVSLDLSEFRDWQPEELFGNTRFPVISEGPYLFTLGSHGFYWLSLNPPRTGAVQAAVSFGPIDQAPRWGEEMLRTLERDALPQYIRECRWFGSKEVEFRELHIVACFSPLEDEQTRVLLIEIAFADRPPVIQVLPLTIGTESTGEPRLHAPVARFAEGQVLWETLHLAEGRHTFLSLISNSEIWKDGVSSISWTGTAFELPNSTSRLLGVEQSNSTVVYGEQVIFKLFRKYESGPHPDTEILRALSQKNFQYTPRYFGEIQCHRNGQSGVLGVLTSYIPNQGDGWTFTLDALGLYFEQALVAQGDADPQEQFQDIVGAGYMERIRQLGIRTGELHRCLESLSGPDFEAESFTGHYQRALYQTLRSLVRRTEQDMRNKIPGFAEPLKESAREWIKQVPRILSFYAKLPGRKIQTKKIRVHGDYHLGQVLNTGKDFVILDFEGEPRRTLGERLLKRSPLVDVAGMIRSFDYALQAALAQQRPEDEARLEMWGQLWRERVTELFLEGYREGVEGATFLPESPEDLNFLIKIFLLDKAVYEIGYELSYRQKFLFIPLKAASRILQNAD